MLQRHPLHASLPLCASGSPASAAGGQACVAAVPPRRPSPRPAVAPRTVPHFALVALACTTMLGGCALDDSVRAARAGRSAVASISEQSAGLAAQANAVLAAPTPNERRVLRPDPVYATLPRYIGTIGTARVEVRMGPKPAGADGDDGVGGWHGEYRTVGGRDATLLAGDVDGTTVTLEESDDGTRISGIWVGQFQNDGGLIGERSDVDGSHALAVDLKRVR